MYIILYYTVYNIIHNDIISSMVYIKGEAN